MIPVVFRTHIKTPERLKLFKLCLESYKEKKLHKLGPLFVIDNQGTMQNELVALTLRYKGTYVLSAEPPGTNYGLAAALRVVENEPYSLQCCDDILFASGAREKVEKIVEKDIPHLGENWGNIQLFCPHTVAHLFRTPQTLLPDQKLHLVDSSQWTWHANLMNVWSQKSAQAYLRNYEAVHKELGTHDDHTQRTINNRTNLDMYVTTICYCLHTGMKNRTFTEAAGGAEYQAAKFAGSNEDRKGW